MPFQSFDDIFKNTSQGFISFDNIFGQQTGFISFDDLFAKQKVDVRRPEPTRRYGGVGNVLEQFGRGAVREATLGLSKYALGEEAPIGFAEKFARGAGQFAGYLIPIGIGAKVAGATVKGASKIASGAIKAVAPRATPKTVQSATRLFEHMFKSSTTLATADVVSDITNISEAPQRAVSGATIGAIFGGSHLINLTKKAPLDNIIRQFAGRGMLMAAGHYSPEHMTKENIPNIVFGEILNTFFLSRGIRAKDIMEATQNAALGRSIIKYGDSQEKKRRLQFGLGEDPGMLGAREAAEKCLRCSFGNVPVIEEVVWTIPLP
ncbi:hypothetical protein LCGC14_2484710, partial [marine sediment metagenome]